MVLLRARRTPVGGRSSEPGLEQRHRAAEGREPPRGAEHPSSGHAVGPSPIRPRCTADATRESLGEACLRVSATCQRPFSSSPEATVRYCPEQARDDCTGSRAARQSRSRAAVSRGRRPDAALRARGADVKRQAMRIAALDVGEARIGVAVSDELGITAQGVGVIRRVGGRRDLEALAALLAPYTPARLVVGLPLDMRGTEGPAAARVRAFAERAAAHLALPLEFWDERLTTVAAERVLLEADVSRRRRREVVDKVAATLILEGYLARQP
ncbi:MAG: Holliday junction resolvase RuvX [Deltaproteobacteria bacterium]|nr:MAG: Holliday junction resolvase RuvX [Deltaproteobacteria bacterium]